MPFALSSLARHRPVRFAALGLAGFALLQLVFFALLIAGAAVPDKPIVEHLAKDVRLGAYGPSHLRDRMGGDADSFTECVVVGSGLGSSGASPLMKAATMPRLASCAVGASQIKALARGKQVAHGLYFRYWAGYTVLTRPALALFGMSGLRIIAGGLLFGSLVVAGRALSRRTGGAAALGLLVPLVLSTNLLSTPSTSLSQALSISAYLFGVALCAWAASRSLVWGLLGTVLAASVFCYVDLLTTPAVGWAFSAATVAGVTFARTRRLRATLLALLLAGIAWPLAFAGTWVARWAIAVPFVGWSRVVEDVKTVVLFRSAGQYRGVSPELWAATDKNIHWWLHRVPTGHAVLWVSAAVALVALVRAFRRGRAHALAALLVAVPALCVPLWYEALRNHSQIHAFFVYRGVPAAVGVVVFATLVAARRAPSPPTLPALVAQEHEPVPAAAGADQR